MTKTTLLIIDVQKGLVDYLPAHRKSELLQTIGALRDKARAANVPVIYVQHQDEELIPGTAAWEIAGEIAPSEGEPVVAKKYRDSFRETNLDELLKARETEHIVISGMQSEFCIDATLREAERRGYKETLVTDAHATYDAEGATEDQIRAQIHRVARGIAETTPVAGLQFQ